MKGFSFTIKSCCWVSIMALFAPNLFAQQSNSNIWEEMELNGRQYKVLGSPTVPKDKKKIPAWIPITGGVIAGGVVTYIILNDDGGTGPATNPPVANSDSFSVPCGQTNGSVEVLSNDTGEGITVTSTVPPTGISISINGGTLQVSGIGASNFSIGYTITDVEGRTASATIQVNVSDSESPTITCPSDISIDCGSENSPSTTGSPDATDLCAGNELTINFADDETGLTGCNNTGTIVRTWTATDFAGNSSQCAQSISILPDNNPPTVNCPANVTVQCGEGTEPAITGTATAEDNCGNSPTLDFEDDNGGLTGCNNTGVIARTWTATDACGLQQSCVQNITLEDTTPPTISCPATATVECDANMEPDVTGTATADDACDSNISMSFEDDDSGLTGCGGTGEITRTWTAADGCGNEQTCSQAISVVDQTPPEVTCPPAITAQCTGPQDPSVTGLPSFSDNCTGNVQANFEDDDSGVNDCMGDLIRTWTVTDDCGNEQTCTQAITITDDAPPVIDCPSNLTVQCGDTTDPAETGTASVDYTCGSPSSGSLEFADDDSGLTGCNATGDLARTWTATDSCGLQSNCIQTITIEDTTAPNITCPVEATVQCDGSMEPAETGEAEGSDDCGSAVTITFEDDDSGLSGCNNTGSLVRTWLATDECGNASNCTQQITVIDTTVPEITCPSNTIVVCLEPNDPAVTGEPTVSDNCTSNPTTTFQDDATGVVNCVGDLIRIWTVIDDCGNSGGCVQILTVIPPECTFTTTFDVQDANCGVSNGVALAIVSPSGDYSFEWSNGSNGPVLSDVPAGSYSVTISEIPLSCFLVFNVTIGELPAQYVSGLQVVPADCPFGGDISFFVGSQGNGPINIDVEGPNGNFTINNVPNGAEVHLQDFINVEPGNYMIQVHDISTGPQCVETFLVMVDQLPPYPLEVIQIIPPSSPSNNDGSIVLQVNDPNHPPPYNVFLNGNFIGNTPDVIIVIQNLPEGIYDIQVTDVNGCPSEVVTVELIAMMKLGIVVPIKNNFTTPTDLNTYGTVEHPQRETWRATDYIPMNWQAIGFSGNLRNGLELRLGMSRSYGLGVFQNTNFQNPLSVKMAIWSASQEIIRPLNIDGGIIRFGAGLYQNYFQLNDPALANTRFSRLELTSPVQIGFQLTSSFEFNIGQYFSYELPVSIVFGDDSQPSFLFGPRVVFRLY